MTHPKKSLVVNLSQDEILKLAEDLAPVYRSLGWVWGGVTTPNHVPSVSDIARVLTDLISHFNSRCIPKTGYSVGTGGLTIRDNSNFGEPTFVTIEFTMKYFLDESNSYVVSPPYHTKNK